MLSVIRPSPILLHPGVVAHQNLNLNILKVPWNRALCFSLSKSTKEKIINLEKKFSPILRENFYYKQMIKFKLKNEDRTKT